MRCLDLMGYHEGISSCALVSDVTAQRLGVSIPLDDVPPGHRSSVRHNVACVSWGQVLRRALVAIVSGVVLCSKPQGRPYVIV